MKSYIVFNHTDSVNNLFYSLSKSTDGGMSWKIQKSWGINDRVFPMSIAYISDEIMYLGCWLNGVVLKTTNGGKNWSMRYIDTIGRTIHIKLISMLDADHGILICDNLDSETARYYTTNDGWETSNELIPPKDYQFLMSNDFLGRKGYINYLEPNVIVCKVASPIYKGDAFARSTDAGKTWSVDTSVFSVGVENGRLADKIYSFRDSKNGYVFTFQYTDTSDKTVQYFFASTTNGGVSWRPKGKVEVVKSDFWGGPTGLQMENDLNGVIYAPVICRTNDGCKTWVRDSVELVPNRLPLMGSGLKVGKKAGIYLFIADGTRLVKDAGLLSSIGLKSTLDNYRVSLYPNPAQRLINIGLQGVGVGVSEVTLFNNIGEKVMSKVISSGVKDLQLDVSILPNGIYSLLIKEGGKTVVKKIVITK
ncbi:MAG: T9SS type A sorting domain-containing protein [Chlorobiota bacterium]|nr:MAG: T9SS type A sorting domain-containing protein [Chlorobiota bacterium]